MSSTSSSRDMNLSTGNSIPPTAPAPPPPSAEHPTATSTISIEPMSMTVTSSGTLAAVIRSSPSAHPSNPPGVVQIRQIRAQPTNSPFKGTPGIPQAPSGTLLFNRQVPQNLTILPGRPTVVTSNFTTRGTTLQLTGTGTRPVPVVSSGGPGSITVTPISGANIVSGLRFTTTPGSTQVTGLPTAGGTWTTGPGTLRPTTAIQVRPVRPEPGKIYLNPSNVVQHVTQLQVVSSSPSSQTQIALKPTQSISIRGTLHPTMPGQGTTGPTPIPLAPFTIRAATITRPGITNVVSMSPTSQVQKVITQPAHGPPIIVNNPNTGATIQRVTSGAPGTITTGIPRLPVAFTLAKGTTLTPSSSSALTTSNPPTLVGIRSAGAPTGNIAVMSSAGLPAGATAKLYPISRDVSTSLVETFITQGHVQTSQSTISSPPTLNVRTSLGLPISRNTTIVTGTPMKGTTTMAGSTGPSGPIVQVGTINIPQSYILPQVRPITLDHTKKLTTGTGPGTPGSTTNLILTTATSSGGTPQPITFPITPGSSAHYATHHPISINKSAISGASGSVLLAPPHLTISPHITLAASPQQGGHGQGPSTSSSNVLVSSTATSGANITPTTSMVIGNSTSVTTIPGTSTLVPSTAGPGAITTSTPSASPKSNLSPRPSILRKRDALILDPNPIPTSGTQASPLRAQRNLSVNFGTITGTGGPPTVLISPANKENTNNNSSSNCIPSFLSTIVTSIPSPMVTSTNVIGTGTQQFTTSAAPSQSSLATSACPLTFLKTNEPFLPPHEESDGSNSSSGSTTLSTTSETAATDLIHLQDDHPHPHPPVSSTNINIPPAILHQAPPPTITVSRSNTTGTSNIQPVININTSHNGILIRSSVPNSYGNLTNASSASIIQHPHPHPTPLAPAITQPPRRAGGAGGRGAGTPGTARRGAGGGDKDKSPRKKPRKQQLNASDYLGASEVSFIQTKRYKKGGAAAAASAVQPPPQSLNTSDEPRIQLGKDSTSSNTAPPPPKDIRGNISLSSSVLTPHNNNKGTASVGRPRTRANSLITYNLTKPRVPLVLSSELPTNTRYNHFERYSDVKSKDERRPTINDLANQRNVDQKISGWKLRHLSGQLDEVIANESGVVSTFVELLGQMDKKFGSGGSLGGTNRDLGRIEDLLKGNIQRCRVIRDQMTESKTQVFKVLDHQPRVSEVIHKYMSRRGPNGLSNSSRTSTPTNGGGSNSTQKQKQGSRNYDKY